MTLDSRPSHGTSSTSLQVAAGELLRRTDDRICRLFESERSTWLERHAELGTAFETLQAAVLGGGKRIRPQFAFHGFVAGGGDPLDERIVDLACALEMLHAFALVHDDVMDDSTLRRHRPTVHEQYRRQHEATGWSGEARRTSEAFAILLGDLAFAWSIRFEIDLPAAVRAELDRVRTELHVGQYLDLLSAASRSRDQDTARSIASYKTATYTVRGPLVLGAKLAGAGEAAAAFTTFGDAVGEAFQHRDDLLGVFGDPARTGKPRFDDLHAGKSTLLLHLTLDRAGSDAPDALGRLGTPEFSDDDAAAVARFMCTSGAVAELESCIAELVDTAVAGLDQVDIPMASRHELARLAHAAGNRIA